MCRAALVARWRAEAARAVVTADEVPGTMKIAATIRNPADPAEGWEGLFLMGTGAMDSLVPRQRLEAIGLEPEGRRVYELADGRKAEMDIAVVRIEIMGMLVGGTVIFGDADAEPILGATALASAGIEIDVQNRQLKMLPAVRLKEIRHKKQLDR